MNCNKCDNEIQEDSVFCNKCGEKVNSTSNDEVAGASEIQNIPHIVSKSKFKTKLIVSISIILVIALSAGGWFYYDYSKKQEAAMKIQREKEYEQDLKKVVSDMLNTSTLAENMINTYSKIWSASIKITLDDSRMASELGINISDVRKYFKNDDGGYIAFQGHFDTALKKMHNYYEQIGKNGELGSSREEISNSIRKLNTPPEKYKDAYNIAFELYSKYENYISFALSPSGSLTTYNQKANELSSNVVTKVKEFEVKLPLK
ncbi:zinc ribbon domain-containing protein [Paenibacillus sp. FSL H8-0034]|uniref:zinc ribbon domain-containing protein n=1 Tax=Paenibacillus sp. FSL H8-0034 TaxID=2954671 RepID=UPI0030FA16E5